MGELAGDQTGHWNGPTVRVKGKLTWDHDVCPSLIRGIQNFHMDVREWSDIAYNFVICPHGHIYEGRGLDVWNGANGTNAGNRNNYAIMWLSGEGNPFTEGEKLGFKLCVRYISDNTLAPAKAIGHRDHKSTACPGDERYKWIHAGMPVSDPIATTPPNEDEVKLDKEDLDAIEAIIGKKLNEGTGNGKENWGDTNKAILAQTQGNTNRLNALLLRESVSAKDLAEALRPVFAEIVAEATAEATAEEIVDKLVERLTS
jgi:hypothetical protein